MTPAGGSSKRYIFTQWNTVAKLVTQRTFLDMNQLFQKTVRPPRCNSPLALRAGRIHWLAFGFRDKRLKVYLFLYLFPLSDLKVDKAAPLQRVAL